MKNKELYELISSLEENANDVKNLLDCSLLIADNSDRSYAMNKIITLLKKGIETIEVMSEWLDADYKQLAKEEKKVQHLKEKYRMKKCINEYLINRYKDSKIATLIEFNVRAKASEKINTLQDFVTSLIYLTPNEYKEIEEKVIGELQKEAIKKATTRPKEEALQAIKCFYCPYFTKDKGAFQCINEIFY